MLEVARGMLAADAEGEGKRVEGLLWELMRKVDVDGNGSVDWGEFEAMLGHLGKNVGYRKRFRQLARLEADRLGLMNSHAGGSTSHAGGSTSHAGGSNSHASSSKPSTKAACGGPEEEEGGGESDLTALLHTLRFYDAGMKEIWNMWAKFRERKQQEGAGKETPHPYFEDLQKVCQAEVRELGRWVQAVAEQGGQAAAADRGDGGSGSGGGSGGAGGSGGGGGTDLETDAARQDQEEAATTLAGAMALQDHLWHEADARVRDA
jgi:hypothetical protein